MQQALITLLFASIFVLIGNTLCKTVPFLRNFTIPGAVIGGVIALSIGPQVVSSNRYPSAMDLTYLYPNLGDFPGLFINVVFACMMLGRYFDSPTSIWRRAKPQVVMGHIFAWGQYVVGLALVLFVLAPIFNISDLAGVTIAIGFQGGHGTAAGLGENFAALGFEQGEAFAMAVATVGILSGVILGPLLVNVILRRHTISDNTRQDSSDNKVQKTAPDSKSNNQNSSPLTGKLTVHLGVIGIVLLCAWGSLKGIQLAEYAIRGDSKEQYFSDFIPLFSVVLVTGMVVQALLQYLSWDRYFERKVFARISAYALDMVIFSALATLSLDIVSTHWKSLLALCITGLSWNLLVFFVLGRYVYKQPWYAYGVGDLGGGTATTASGILLIKMIDPNKKTDAMSAYADKQPFYEPIMGGGLVTAFALPILASVGIQTSLLITTTILTVWLAFAWHIGHNREAV
ncbi:sodium/glutamate symporter [Alteromonas sp. P256]|uniref:sodium/glutamate symporter n=1 Tax=Alteromonas sp. P256 TaxID=3117399 RepID=UPI002FE2E053